MAISQAPLLGMMGLALLACQERTQVTLDLSTDLPCADVTETAISVGEFAQIERTTPIALTPGCRVPEALAIGTLAVVPTDDKDAKWGTRIVTAINAEASTCQPPEYGPQCIIARRSTRFIDGRGYSLLIPMRESCLGVLCPDDQTCVDGVCRSADVGNCVENDDCDEGELPIPEARPWRRAIGGVGEDIPNDLAAMPGGDVVVTGSFSQSVDFGGGGVHEGQQDMFVARLGPSGEYRWSKSLGADGFDSGLGVHVSRTSVIVVTGTATGEVPVGDLPPLQADIDDSAYGYVLAYAGLGTERWVTQLTGPGKESALDSATDSKGNVYVAVSFSNELSVAGEPVASGMGVDGALVKLDPFGAHVWTRALGGLGVDGISDVVVDSQDNIYVSGSFEQEITVGGDTAVSRGNKDVLLVSFTPDGDARWLRTFGGGANDLASGLAIDDSDTLAVTGALSGPVTYGDAVLQAGDHDGFVLRLDTDGTHLWHATFCSAVGTAAGESVAFDGDGQLLVSGYFHDALSFGDGNEPMTGTGVRNTFVAAYDATAPRYTRAFRASHYATSRAIAASVDGSMFITGFFAREMNFDGEVLSSVHGASDTGPETLHADIFLGRIPPP